MERKIVIIRQMIFFMCLCHSFSFNLKLIECEEMMNNNLLEPRNEFSIQNNKKQVKKQFSIAIPLKTFFKSPNKKNYLLAMIIAPHFFFISRRLFELYKREIFKWVPCEIWAQPFLIYKINIFPVFVR